MAKQKAKTSSGAQTVGSVATIPYKPVMPVTTRKQKAHKGVGTALGIAFAVILILVAVVYGAGVYYFKDHFLPYTEVNGQDVSLKDGMAVAHAIDAKTAAYKNTVVAGNFQYTVKAADINLKSDGDECAKEALAQNKAYQWPMQLLKHHDVQVNERVSYDNDKLSKLVGEAVDAYNAKAEKPQDASVTYDSHSGSYVVNGEVDGTTVNKDVIMSSALESVKAMATQTTPGDNAKVKAGIKGNDANLNQAAQQANAILAQNIPLKKSDGSTVATVSHDQLASWVRLDNSYHISLDKPAMQSWVKQNLAQAVPAEDDTYKYSLDARDTTSALAASIKAGTSQPVTVEVAKVAKPRPVDGGDAPAGTYDPSKGSYVDVDLANQYARFYANDGSVAWESYIVSGNENKSRSTPTGTFQIDGKATDVTLVGLDENGDGEPDYQSHVSYWMPFVGNSIGLHDATWRSNFGGNIYATSGSHGCVNLPADKAKELYNLVSDGTTVYVH